MPNARSGYGQAPDESMSKTEYTRALNPTLQSGTDSDREDHRLYEKYAKMVTRKGRIRSAERVEAHLQHRVFATFFQPDVRTPGGSMKGGRYVD
jgi:hypothetical protein